MKKMLWFIGLLISLMLLIYFSPTSPSSALLNEIEDVQQEYEAEFNESKYAILIDYSKPFYKKRLWVVEVETKKVVLNSHVSHAKNSGKWYATEFSNEVGSEFSCTGIFKTLYAYESQFGKGKYKIGMRVEGLEKGKNDHAKGRHIVFHTSYGIWSKGCFMTWPKVNKELIELTKDGNMVLVRP